MLGVPLAMVVTFHLSHILVERFSRLSLYYSKFQKEEVKCGSGERKFLVTFVILYAHNPVTASLYTLDNMVPVCYQGSYGWLTLNSLKIKSPWNTLSLSHLHLSNPRSDEDARLELGRTESCKYRVYICWQAAQYLFRDFYKILY